MIDRQIGWGVLFRPTRLSGLFGYFPPFLSAQARGSRLPAFLAAESPKGDRVRVFPRIGVLVLGGARRQVHNQLGKLVWIAGPLGLA